MTNDFSPVATCVNDLQVRISNLSRLEQFKITTLHNTTLNDTSANIKITQDTVTIYNHLQQFETSNFNHKVAVVIGAGAVGLTLTLNLLKAGIKVILLDKKVPQAFNPNKLDLKVLAINHANVNFLKTLGAWKYIKNLRACSYNTVSLYSNYNQELLFTADELGISELGYMLENNAITTGLLQACLEYQDNFTFISDWEIEQALQINTTNSYISISRQDKPGISKQHWQIKFTNGVILETSIVLACDGMHSFWRNKASIPTKRHDYPSKCMLIHVQTDSSVTTPYHHHTWQKIDQFGPKAWLPISANEGILVWYDEIATIDSLLKRTPASLTNLIKQNFPQDRIGNNLEVINFTGFNLVAMRAEEYWQNNILIFGDAAHTVSPLAGQGLNLGLQDVECFNSLIHNINIRCFNQLGRNYSRERYMDNFAMQEFLSLLHHSYISPSPVASCIRNKFFKISEFPILKRYALAYACGDRELLKGIHSFCNFTEGLLVGIDPYIKKVFGKS